MAPYQRSYNALLYGRSGRQASDRDHSSGSVWTDPLPDHKHGLRL